MVEDSGELHTTNLYESCYNLRQSESKEPTVCVGVMRSRGKLEVGLGAMDLEHKVMGQEDPREESVERNRACAQLARHGLMYRHTGTCNMQ